MSYEPKHDLEQSGSHDRKHDLDLEPQETRRRGSVFSTRSARRFSISDEVFGEITEAGPNYRDVSILVITSSHFRLTAYRLVGWALLLS